MSMQMSVLIWQGFMAVGKNTQNGHSKYQLISASFTSWEAF